MRYLFVTLVAISLMIAPVSAWSQDTVPTPDVIVVADAVAPAPTVDILGPAVDVMATLAPMTVAIMDATTADVPKTPDAKTPDALESNIPISQNEAEAIAQAGEAISAFAIGSWFGGILLLIGVAVFVYRKYFMKKKVTKA